MKRLTTLFIICALSTLTVAAQRTVINLDFGWRFSHEDKAVFAAPSYDDSQWRTVDLPHDFQIEQPWVVPAADERADNSDAAANIKSRLSSRGFKEMGRAWYRLHLTLPDSLRGRRLLLDFGGIMYVGDVYVNGKLMGGTEYGYVGFEIDATEQLKFDSENIIAVMADTRQPQNSRWYTGGGLFRSVNLVATSRDVYFARHPLYITTHDNRYVSISAEVVSKGRDKKMPVALKITDADGKTVYEGKSDVRRSTPTRIIEQQLPEIEIPDPQVWDTEHPYLYTVEATLYNERGEAVDRVTDHFGLRTVEIGSAFGLKLNGKKVLLKGYANHHTLGALGAAAYPRAIEKRIQMMKEWGINHIRTSHNPYSKEFIDLCDKYGILVVDELYDKWTRQHTGGRSSFEALWQYDVPEWVKRDRNAPSVVMWSLGNELQQDPNQPYNDYGVTMYRLMRPLVSRYDSTRLVTVAMHPRYRNWQTDSLPCDLAMITDVQAYNYRYMYFPGDGRRFPWMTFYQSEASVAAMGQNYFEMDLDRVIGLAYWGAIDYLGESQGWPAKGWAQGVFYIDVQPKPKAYFMKSFFTDEPMVRLSVMEDKNAGTEWNGIITGTDRQSELWNRPEGSKANLVIYTNCDEVELTLNGKSLGRRQNPTDAKNRNRINWNDVDYKKGRLEAIAYRNGKAVARHALETTGKPVRIIAEPDNSNWKADGMDLQHVLLTAVDAKGRKVLTYQDELTFDVEGDATIVAVTNGDINSDELNATNHRRLWQGQAMVILRAGKSPSKVTLKTSPTTFKPIITKLETK